MDSVRWYIMVKLRCDDYGFECDFEVEGDEDHVVEQFMQHNNEEHGIDYRKEAVKKFIRRKYPV
jgi:predicted small metal-binding protein